MLIRWLVHYPVVHLTYRVRGWTRAPFHLEPGFMEKPGILVSNYGNFFYDDFIGMMMGPVVPFVFVRHSLYRLPLLKYVFRFFRALPIVRTADRAYTPEQRLEFNNKTFARVAELLRKGNWLSVFPEQSPSHRPRLATPLKPGVAHVALRAEDSSGWSLGLRVYVYGTNYENKFASRSDVYIRWAAPIEVAKYREAYLQDPLKAEQALMSEIESALHSAVLEAPALEQLADAYRLAYQQNRANFSGVQSALAEVVSGRSTPEQMRKIICRRGRESVLYQVVGFALLGLGAVIGWPFRMFGKLCATDRSQEMTFQFILWALVLITGAIVSEAHWALFQALATWGSTNIWLWAWRRGVLEKAI